MFQVFHMKWVNIAKPHTFNNILKNAVKTPDLNKYILEILYFAWITNKPFKS